MDAQSVLIADPDPALWQELSPALCSWLPNKRLDCCTTHREALDRVVDPLYDVVISSGEIVENAVVVPRQLVEGKTRPDKALSGHFQGENFIVPL